MNVTGAARFLDLHRSPGTFVLPNAWDPGSAKVLAHAGFPALATTSAGIAFAAGLPDDGRIGRDRMVKQIAAIVAAVDIPVSADIESGYASTASGVADTIRAVIGAGAVGANVEDADPATAGLFAPGEAAARVEVARAAADAEGVPFTINARIDSFLAASPEPLLDAVSRASRYAAAGADCIFVPGVSDAEMIGRLVEAIPAPLNLVVGLSGKPLALSEYERLGVRRISVGGTLARGALGVVRRAAADLRKGRFDFAADAIPHPELNRLMEA